MSTMTFLRRRGMGDWQGDVAAAVAGDELNQLTSAIFKLNDNLVSSIESRNGIINGYRTAKAEMASATSQFGSVTDEDSGAYTAALAWTGALKAVKTFARQIQTLSELSVIFHNISAQLFAAGLKQDSDAIDGTTRQIDRFVMDSDAVFATIPEYAQTKRDILSAFNAQLKSWGVDANANSDPRWFAAFVQAADSVVPIDRPSAPGELASTGVSGMGQLGNPMPVAIVALLWVIAIAAVTITLMYGISKTLDALNSEAVTARQLILQRDQEKEVLRQKMMDGGKSQEEINTQMQEFDQETKEQTKAIPKSPLAGLVLPLALLGGGIFAAFVVPQIMKKL